MKCKACEKELKGLNFHYSQHAYCGKCANQIENVMYCETGDKVIVNSLNNGYEHDKELAKKHLRLGGIYTIQQVDVGGWNTEIELAEIPNVRFNSVHFKRIVEVV